MVDATPRIIRMALCSDGSSTCTTWKRRVSAGSFSMCFLYSAQVVAATVRRVPRARAGLSRLAASPVPAAAGADQGVGFVDEQDDRLLGTLHVFDHLAQALLELALHARPGLQQADVEGAQFDVLQRRRDVAGDDAQGEAFHHRGLADAGLAGEDRVVLPAAHEDVHQLADLLVTPDDGVELAAAGLLGEVHGKALERLLLAHRARRQAPLASPGAAPALKPSLADRPFSGEAPTYSSKRSVSASTLSLANSADSPVRAWRRLGVLRMPITR